MAWQAWIAVSVLVSASSGTSRLVEAQAVRVTGQVVAGEPRHPVAGAEISAGVARATADADGRFALDVPTGSIRLDVTARGYLAAHVDIVAAAGMSSIEILLVASPSLREDVTVSATGARTESAPASMNLPPAAVIRVPGAADNIFKALQTLPGVNGTDDFGSRLSVRGGGPDQNLTIMDGVEIHNPYRLFGLTSAFNPEIVDTFELTAGGFSAKYGDRLSSLLVIENRAGTSQEAFAGSAAISFTDGNVVAEGKLPGANTGSWLLTGRRTYYDLVADKITGSDLPSFNDLQGKGVWEPKPGHRLTLFGLRSREGTDATLGSKSSNYVDLGDVSSNDVASVTYNALVGRLNSRTLVSWYNYLDRLDVDGSLDDDTRRANTRTPSTQPKTAIVFTRDLGVRDLAVRQEWALQAGPRHFIEAGAEGHRLRTTLNWIIAGDRNPSVANGSDVRGGAGLPAVLQANRLAARSGAWIQDRVQISDRLRIEPGLRVDRSGMSAETLVSPRLRVDADISARTRVKAAFGRYTQSPGYEKLLQSDYFLDLADRPEGRLSSERSIHALGGLERTLTPAVTARVEVYYKQFDRLIIGRLETPTETAARVAAYDFPASLSWSVPAAAQITSVPVNAGRGHAHGFDVYLEKRARSARERVSGWMSYTWGRATTEAYGVTRPFDYDRRHAFSLVSTVALKPRIELGATVRVASGFPTTTPMGVRVAAEEATDGSGRLVPARDEAGNLVWTVDLGDASNLGSGRLPVFARVDLRLTFKPKSATGRWQLYLEVINALNRKNVSTLEPQLQYDPTSDRPRISYGTDSGLPLLPSFGFRYRF